MDDRVITAMPLIDDEQWYAALIDRYTPYVTAIISGICKGSLPGSDIEEAAADVFFRVWRKKDQIRTDNIKAYIAQIARNAGIDRLRQRGIELIPYDDDILQLSREGLPDELAIAREQREIVKTAVGSFQEPDKEIFIRFYFFGETIRVIAERLKINASTIKTKLRRARSKLRDIMHERGYGCEQEGE